MLIVYGAFLDFFVKHDNYNGHESYIFINVFFYSIY